MKYGWAEEKLVFPKPVALMGQFATRISEYEEKPLTVTALAVDSGDDQMVLCSVDLITITYVITDEVRKRLANCAPGLDPMKVVISAIHTHTGPGFTSRGARKVAEGMDPTAFTKKINSLVPPEKQYVESPNVYKNPDIMSGDELFEEICSKIAKSILLR